LVAAQPYNEDDVHREDRFLVGRDLDAGGPAANEFTDVLAVLALAVGEHADEFELPDPQQRADRGSLP
jgi:hypothetical protein